MQSQKLVIRKMNIWMPALHRYGKSCQTWNEDISKLLQCPHATSGHTAAKPDTEICVAAGCLIKRVQLCAGAFFLEKNPGVLPYTVSTEALPSFKIATINQEDFKGYNAQFHGRLFQLPANVIPISPLRYCTPPSICPSHFDSSTICPFAH